MEHKYFCTHCGRELNQQIVLFDMQHVLTGNAKERFDILSFRLTKAELERITASGTRGDMNYVHYEIPFAELMGYICNKNNLNDPAIGQLTLEQIKAFLDQMKESEFGLGGTDDLPGGDDDFDDFDDLVSSLGAKVAAEEEVNSVQEKDPSEAWPAPIQALRKKDTTNKSLDETQKMMQRDLSILKNLFENGETYRMELLLLEEDDDQKQKVLYGYRANAGATRLNTTVEFARMCPFCGSPVFEHAGTAEHRTVAFIGDQKSGKTSTILALTHYAMNGMLGAVSTDPIWGKSKAIPSILDKELLLGKDDSRLRNDLAKYEDGLPPDKTSAGKREDAYSATFRIKNQVQKDKYYILTLIDLPGELCDPETGKIDVDNVMNNFPVALACEMFILCFDATTAVGGKAVSMVENVCKWANQFQSVRQEYWKNAVSQGIKTAFSDDCFAPVMILYTKCPELEDPSLKKSGPVRRTVDRVDASYIFQKERMEINENEIYKRAGSRFKDFDNLRNVYQARLRCSPFGYPASKTNPRIPTPANIDLLMRWILSVTGCIETEATFLPDLNDSQKRYTIARNFVERPQYRAQNPNAEGKDSDLRESLNRCYLFENPGAVDRALVESYDNDMMLLKIRGKVKMRMMKN